jgi:FMN phosphatase YigB (HAD superfamily)
MNLTLLLDLDDTLLGNNMNDFIPAYIQGLSGFIASKHPPERFVSILMAATQSMLKNNDPTLTLKKTFDQNFYPALNTHEAILQDKISQFYSDIFPQLKTTTHLHPEASKLVSDAQVKGYTLAIATNPLFPKTAISQRIEWAGLDPDSFALISSYESFHFAKPNPAYFAEMLGRMGWPNGGVIMVGNDLKDDITPANQLGLATFWVNDAEICLDSPQQACGNLTHIQDWISRFPVEQFIPRYHTSASHMATLRSTPAVLDTLFHELPKSLWNTRPRTDEWALVEIICHLRDVDVEVNIPRIDMMLKQNNPFITAIDTDVWATQRNYIQEDGVKAFEEFIVGRTRLLNLLDTIDHKSWHCSARHAIFGPTTLLEIVSFMAGHERLHIRQVTDTLRQIKD